MHREIIQGHKGGNVIQQPIASFKHNEQIKSLFELRATYYNGLVYKNKIMEHENENMRNIWNGNHAYFWPVMPTPLYQANYSTV
jgi:hypothetical protein